jgi:predicted acetyltransferase
MARQRAFDVRPVATIDEFEAAFLSIGQYFAAEPKRERMEQFLENMPLDRMHAAWDDRQIVGGAGAFPMQLSIPGGGVRCAGVSIVGVAPTHRRRGVLRAMMRVQLDDVRERREPIAGLWASEETIYGRFGYGFASFAGQVQIAREHTDYALPFESRGAIRFVEPEEALERFPHVWERFCAERPGAFRRSSTWWQYRVLADPPERREGGGPKRLALLTIDGEDAAYAVYRHNPGWQDGVSTGRLAVIEAIGSTAMATAEIWRFLLDIDWQATIVAGLLPIDHPLFFLLAKPRRLRYRVGDGLWIRIVDMSAALSARSYAADDEIVFDVVDAFAPWNAGHWKVGPGRCEPTTREPDLTFDITALGSVYLGGFTCFARRSHPGVRRFFDSIASCLASFVAIVFVIFVAPVRSTLTGPFHRA